MLRAVAELKTHGCRHPWRLLFTAFKSRYLPHRAYLHLDGPKRICYEPPLLGWYLGSWRIWQAKPSAKTRIIPFDEY